MHGEDWTDYYFQPPPPTLLCQFRRIDERGCLQFVGFSKDMVPEFKSVGLQWKLTGIAREQLDRMPYEVQMQVMLHPSLNLSFGQMLAQGTSRMSGLR